MANEKCKCGREHCKGFVLLHPKELFKIKEIKERELKEFPKANFMVDPSPTSGEIFITFYEMHVINDSNTPEKDIGSVIFTKPSDEEIGKRRVMEAAFRKAMDQVFAEKEGKLNAV